MEEGAVTATVRQVSEWEPTSFFAPWYKDSSGNSVPYHDADAHPWRYDELIMPRELEAFDYPEDATSDQILSQNAKVLTLDLKSKEHLVLDGNHRLMLKLGKLAMHDISLPWYRIHASLELALVPDVVHWSQ